MTALALRRPNVPLPAVAAAAAAAWLVAWLIEAPAAEWMTFSVLGLAHETHLGEAVAFFLEDLPKVLLLLTGIVTAVTLIRGFFPPERIRPLLAGRGLVPGSFAAAGLGIVTPFCSCSAVPLFIGFVEAGVPLGVTFAFLISSPMVNEVALVMLWGLFGPGIALAYMAAGLAVAIVGGLFIGRLHLERYVESYVYELQGRPTIALKVHLTWADRLGDAWAYTRGLVRKLLPYLILGIGLGALIHGYAPTDLVAAIGGRSNPLAVPLVVVLAVPMYSNAAGTIPIVQALLGKGMPLGTTLAFMMAVTAISLPEFVILRRVIKLPLLAVFIGTVSTGILVIGYLFNFLVS
ncbi:MAG TPA: permease [Terriglobales bacterium]|nr:permease [Terriglobales bacterium]